ncbi:oleoyl-[acyl-carrier-protein] hydrolase [Sarracenia purpurea var. burkii]
MLKLPLSSSCNASSADNYQAKKRHLIGASLTPFSIRRPNASVSCASSSSSSVSDPILTVATGEPKGKDAGLEKSLGDRLRLGSLMEDGSSYKEKFIVRCFEVGINKTATIETIANLLQEVACNHIQSIGFSRDGFGTAHTMRKLNLIWEGLGLDEIGFSRTVLLMKSLGGLPGFWKAATDGKRDSSRAVMRSSGVALAAASSRRSVAMGAQGRDGTARGGAMGAQGRDGGAVVRRGRDGATEATRSGPRRVNSTAEDRGAAVVHNAGSAGASKGPGSGAGDDESRNSPGWSGWRRRR